MPITPSQQALPKKLEIRRFFNVTPYHFGGSLLLLQISMNRLAITQIIRNNGIDICQLQNRVMGDNFFGCVTLTKSVNHSL